MVDIKRNFIKTQKWYVHDSSAVENLKIQMNFFIEMSIYTERLIYIVISPKCELTVKEHARSADADGKEESNTEITWYLIKPRRAMTPHPTIL